MCFRRAAGVIALLSVCRFRGSAMNPAYRRKTLPCKIGSSPTVYFRGGDKPDTIRLSQTGRRQMAEYVCYLTDAAFDSQMP